MKEKLTRILLTQKLYQSRFVLLSSAIGVVGVPLLLSVYVSYVTKNNRYTNLTNVPTKPVAVVFGAGVYPDGSLSPMLYDRVQKAVELYKHRLVKKILMTGDNSVVNYDEVTAMKLSAIKQGVPEKDITLDYAGFSTYESCYRARAIFGVNHAILVTQAYHLPRAVYTCGQLGIDAVGVGIPDWNYYPTEVMIPYALREIIATMKAVWLVNVTRPQPTFLGKFEGIK